MLLPASSGWGPGRLLNVLQDTAPAARTDRLPSVRNSMPGAQPYKLCGSPVAVRGCSVALMSWVSRPGEPGFEPRLLGHASAPPLSLGSFICEMGAATDEISLVQRKNA